MWTVMNDGVLSQQEIDFLLRGGADKKQASLLTEGESDMLGEVGNISMATAATALSQILNNKVEITTPKVTVTTLKKLQESTSIPNVIFQVKFTRGLEGSNVLLINVPDAAIIANLMIGGDSGEAGSVHTLSDMQMSAVSEAMNQMIGSASTSLAAMLGRSINITPPTVQVWDGHDDIIIDGIEAEQTIVQVAFRMTVEDMIDSHIMQLFHLDTVKDITNSLLSENAVGRDNARQENKSDGQSQQSPEANLAKEAMEEAVLVQKPKFGELQNKPMQEKPQNIDLIMDVPLELNVVLGKTQRTIREVLALTPGSVVELNKLAEEPLEIYVNGKLLAQGEVVVINENFGIRITNIISAGDRVKSLG
jgi:flagellar motor switch protein FliN/FliY